jgi:hypothetical protein
MARATLPGRPARVEAHGLRADLPHRWEGRIYLRSEEQDSHAPNPVVHLANFALPPGRGDFGTGAVEVMGRGQVFVSLFEYGPEEAHRPLFAHLGMPRPRANEFSANALQRRLRGQGGWQRFFTEADRAFSLYVVLGALSEARERAPEISQALSGLRIGDR